MSCATAQTIVKASSPRRPNCRQLWRRTRANIQAAIAITTRTSPTTAKVRHDTNKHSEEPRLWRIGPHYQARKAADRGRGQQRWNGQTRFEQQSRTNAVHFSFSTRKHAFREQNRS